MKVKLDGTNMLRNEGDCAVAHHSAFSEHVHGYVLIDNIGVISILDIKRLRVRDKRSKLQLSQRQF